MLLSFEGWLQGCHCEIFDLYLQNDHCGAHMSILFIIKVNFLFLIKRSYRFPQSCWILNLEWLTNFEHVVQSLGVIAHDKYPRLWLTCLPGSINCLSPRLSSRSKFGQMGTHEASLHLTRAMLWQAVCRCSLHLSGTYTWLQILGNPFILF